MNILKGELHMGGLHQRSARSLHDFGMDNILLEIPSGGLLTRFCYVRGASWLVVMYLLREGGGDCNII